MLIAPHLTSSAVSFTKNTAGTTGPMFALMLVPALMMVGGAVDYVRTSRTKAAIQSAVDSVALAVAKNASMTLDEGNALLAATIANHRQSIPPAVTITTKLEKSGSTVIATASFDFPMTVAAIIKPKIPLSLRGKAVPPSAGNSPVCMLALNAIAPEAVITWGTADLTAPNCLVQANSTSSTALMTGGSATATAAKFCTGGGFDGTAFSPTPTVCAPAIDPFANTMNWTALTAAEIPETGKCDTTGKLSVKKNTTYSVSASGVYRFCGGIIIQAGAVVTFEPGTYVINGEMKVSAGAEVNAPEGVTFLFASGSTTEFEDGFLTVQGGANFKVQAPKTGTFAGLALVNPTVSTYLPNKTTAAITHTIIGGGTVEIVGIFYAPQAKIRVTGNGTVNGTSTYFGMIADFVDLQGNGELFLNTASDHSTAGMPPMPQANFGATVSKLVN